MGFLDKVLGGKKSKLVTLTEIGKDKVENAVGDETKSRYIIMADLDEHGASSIHEIAERKGLEESRVKVICQKLISEQLARTVNE